MIKLTNNRGSIVLIATAILYTIIVVASAFTLAHLNELKFSKNFYHSISAFWLAEAGANIYMANPSMLDAHSSVEIPYANGTIYLTRDDSQPLYRYIYSTGVFGNISRKVRITYPANVPEALKKVMSTSGGISIEGLKTSAMVYGQINVSGNVGGNAKKAEVMFEDLTQEVAPNLATLTYPDDKFTAFKSANRALIGRYSPEEVLHIKSDGSHELTAQEVKNKRIVFVEGSFEGSGNVNIASNSIVGDNQHLTIIATGSVNINQDVAQATNSQLNVIAWGDYNETNSAPSTHRGIIYTHKTANFDNIKYSSTTSGSIIAKEGIVLKDIWSTKIFNYAELTQAGSFPAGFEALKGASVTGVGVKPVAWKEV